MMPIASDIPPENSESCVPTSLSADSRDGSTLGPALRAELLHAVMLPDFERADAIASHPSKGDWTGVVTANTAMTAVSALKHSP